MAGWVYAPWRGTFYPPGVVQKLELEYASEHVDTIEIDATSRRLLAPTSYRSWYARTPDDFVFALKGHQRVTHFRRFAGGAGPIADFFASGPLALEGKLGPVLWQGPDTFAFDAAKLDGFLSLLPHSTEDAVRLVRDHAQLDADATWVDIAADRRIHHAFEIGNPSFVTEAFTELLRKHDVALVFTDAGPAAELREFTADHVYARLHGDPIEFADGYTGAALDRWAADIRDWVQGNSDGVERDVFAYRNRTAKPHTPADAMRLREKLTALGV
jgi:uncharacterized protein YecE (DUF72 family)